MFADYSAEIKIAIFQPFRNAHAGASIPMGQGGHVPHVHPVPPNIYEGGDIHGNVPPNILEVMFRMSARVTATVVCCILMQILCVVSQKKASASGGLRPPDPLPGLCPGPHWGTSVSQTPSLPLCPPQ